MRTLKKIMFITCLATSSLQIDAMSDVLEWMDQVDLTPIASCASLIFTQALGLHQMYQNHSDLQRAQALSKNGLYKAAFDEYFAKHDNNIICRIASPCFAMLSWITIINRAASNEEPETPAEFVSNCLSPLSCIALSLYLEHCRSHAIKNADSAGLTAMKEKKNTN